MTDATLVFAAIGIFAIAAFFGYFVGWSNGYAEAKRDVKRYGR